MDDDGSDGDTDGPQADAHSAELEPTRSNDLAQLDPAQLPATLLTAAAPSKPVRGLAFGSIVIGGVCGGLIGYAFTDLQCEDGCAAWAGVSGIIGALIGAIGVAIVAVLVLRAMDEWESVKDQDPADHPARRRPS